jgi:NAD dependent epimerase/dehydratase family enzyme
VPRDRPAGAIDGADALVHLAGAGIADGRWSAARKRALVSSRVDYTRTVVAAIAAAAVKP